MVYANHYSQLAFYNDDMLLAIAEGELPLQKVCRPVFIATSFCMH